MNALPQGCSDKVGKPDAKGDQTSIRQKEEYPRGKKEMQSSGRITLSQADFNKVIANHPEPS
jgi:hypothetical protein